MHTEMAMLQGVTEEFAEDGGVHLGDQSAAYLQVSKIAGSLQILDAGGLRAEVDSLFQQWRAGLGQLLPASVAPKIVNRDEHDLKGTKLSVQIPVGLPQLALAQRESLSRPVVQMFEAAQLLLAMSKRNFDFRLPCAAVLDTFVTVRVIVYFRGQHAPQRPHMDPSVATIVYVPPFDSSLIARGKSAGELGLDNRFHRPAGWLMPGAFISSVLPGATATEHLVLPFDRQHKRIVGTAFLHLNPVLFSGTVKLVS